MIVVSSFVLCAALTVVGPSPFCTFSAHDCGIAFVLSIFVRIASSMLYIVCCISWYTGEGWVYAEQPHNFHQPQAAGSVSGRGGWVFKHVGAL